MSFFGFLIKRLIKLVPNHHIVLTINNISFLGTEMISFVAISPLSTACLTMVPFSVQEKNKTLMVLF